MKPDIKVYVVERHDPAIAETTIEGVWSAQTYAWEYVIEALTDEKIAYQAQESIGGRRVFKDDDLQITECAGVKPGQRQYALVDEGEYEFVVFYVTEVPYNE